MRGDIANRFKSIAAVLVGLVFLFGALAKVSYIGFLEKVFAVYIPFLDAELCSRLLLGFEASLGLSLIFSRKNKFLLCIALLSLLFFSLYLVFVVGDAENCGCFGKWVIVSSKYAVVKNIILTILCLLCLRNATALTRKSFLVPLVVCLPVFSFFLLMPISRSLPLDGNGAVQGGFLETVEFNNLKEDYYLGGKSLVAFFSPSCRHCGEMALQLSARREGTPLYLVFLESERAEIESFLKTAGLEGVPWAMPSLSYFFDNIGASPPRLYLLQDGSVIKYWDGEVDMGEILHVQQKKSDQN